MKRRAAVRSRRTSKNSKDPLGGESENKKNQRFYLFRGEKGGCPPGGATGRKKGMIKGPLN